MINRDLLDELCEGNDSTADLCAKLIEQNPDADAYELADIFADSLSGFYDPDNGLTEEEHWENNREWGWTIFDEYFDEAEGEE